MQIGGVHQETAEMGGTWSGRRGWVSPILSVEMGGEEDTGCNYWGATSLMRRT